MSRWKRRHLKSPRSLTVSSASRSHSGCVLHQGMHAIDSRPFHFMTIRPPIPQIQCDLENSRSKVKIKGTPSQCSVLLTHFLSVSHQSILSTPVPFVPWQSGLLFPGYNLNLKIQGQRSRSKVPQLAQCPDDSFPQCFSSGHPNNSRTFCSMTIGPPIPRYNLTLKIQGQRSRSSIP